MSEEKQGFAKEYSEQGFWGEAHKSYAKTAGKEVMEKALWLYYAAQEKETPSWAKTAIYAALGYFIFPVDAIPDPIPVVGYADDLGVLVAAIATVALFINDNVKTNAARKLRDWFGE